MLLDLHLTYIHLPGNQAWQEQVSGAAKHVVSFTQVLSHSEQNQDLSAKSIKDVLRGQDYGQPMNIIAVQSWDCSS